MTIFGSWPRELLWLYVPGALAVLFSYWIVETPTSLAFLVFAFIAKVFLDSGHVYVTLWRTYFDRHERRRSRMYVWVPAGLFVAFFIWAYFQIPFLGSFIVYATIFHNVRQFFGVSKWYQRLHGTFRKESDHFLYFFCFMPFFMAHFREDLEWTSYYSSSDILQWPDALLFKRLFYIYLAVVVTWIAYELRLALRARAEWSRVLSVAYPAFIYGAAFLFGRNIAQILFPLVVSHALAYIGLTWLSVQRVRRLPWAAGLVVALLFLTALVFGAGEMLLERNWVDLEDPRLAVVAALYLTPLFCHYVFDAMIWRKGHPDSALIYSSTVSNP